MPKDSCVSACVKSKVLIVIMACTVSSSMFTKQAALENSKILLKRVNSAPPYM
jgi:hypothetical protein